MKLNEQAIIVSEIIDIFGKYEVSGIEAIATLEFMKYHILKGDLIR